MNISMKLVYQYMVIFFTSAPPSSHHHPLQGENCDSISRLVVDDDDNGKFRLERVKEDNLNFVTWQVRNLFQGIPRNASFVTNKKRVWSSLVRVTILHENRHPGS